MTLEEISDAARCVEHAKGVLRRLEQDHRRIVCEHWGLVSGETVVIEVRDRGRCRRALFVGIANIWDAEQPWIMGRVFKKNGEPSKSAVTIYSPWVVA